MLVFTVLLFVMSALAAPPAIPKSLSTSLAAPSKTFKNRQSIVVSDVVPQSRSFNRQAAIDHVPQFRNAFINQQPRQRVQKNLAPQTDETIGVHQARGTLVRYETRQGVVDSSKVTTVPSRNTVAGVVPRAQVQKVSVEPKHHVAGHFSDNFGVVAKESSVDDTTNDPAFYARVMKQESEVNPDGTFFNVWNSDNGISVQEERSVKRVQGKSSDDDKLTVQQRGVIAYVDNEGTQYQLKYIADEMGFHAEGEHLPTPPPIPAAIARSLEYIAAHPYVETTTVLDQ